MQLLRHGMMFVWSAVKKSSSSTDWAVQMLQSSLYYVVLLTCLSPAGTDRSPAKLVRIPRPRWREYHST
eukprot:1526935-Rhodomonas_salina.2